MEDAPPHGLDVVGDGGAVVAARDPQRNVIADIVINREQVSRVALESLTYGEPMVLGSSDPYTRQQGRCLPVPIALPRQETSHG
jgi:hypothetical protein